MNTQPHTTKKENANINVTFDERTNIEDGFDYLYIYNANNNEVGKYTGTELAGKTVNIPGNKVKIKIVSDNGGTEWGFKVTNVEAGISKHTCTYDNGTVTTAATCTQSGIMTYTCTICGDTKTEEIPASGHEFDDGTTVKAATCTEAGEIKYTCTKCGASYTNVLVKTGHNYKSTVVAPTCKQQGYTNYVCANCGDTYTDDYVSKTDHTYCAGKITTTPTCTQSGIMTYTCTTCGDTKTEEIPAIGHEFDDGTTVKATTCTEAGEIKYTCMRCRESYTEKISASGHDYFLYDTVEPDCTEGGYSVYVCWNCDNEYYADFVPATGHDYVTDVNKAEINKNGSIVTQCSECGSIKSESTIYAIKSISLSASSYTYDGKTKTPTVTVKDSKGNTVNSKYYTVKYTDGRKNIGKYSVKVTFKGNYYGSKTLYFTINPKGTSISKLTAGKKAFTVKWNKQKTQTTGYQIQYSTSSKFKNAKTVTVSKNSTTSKTIKKLKGKKKYYVRVRTYKTVKINGKNTKIYSSWSKAKSVKTK